MCEWQNESHKCAREGLNIAFVLGLLVLPGRHEFLVVLDLFIERLKLLSEELDAGKKFLGRSVMAQCVVCRASHIDELVLLQIVFLKLLVCFIESTETSLFARYGASNAARHIRDRLLEASHDAVATVDHGHGHGHVLDFRAGMA